MKKLSKFDILSGLLMFASIGINFAGNYIGEKREEEKRTEAIAKAVSDYMAKKES